MPRNSPKTNSVTSTLSAAGPAPGSLLPSIQLQCSHKKDPTGSHAFYPDQPRPLWLLVVNDEDEARRREKSGPENKTLG